MGSQRVGHNWASEQRHPPLTRSPGGGLGLLGPKASCFLNWEESLSGLREMLPSFFPLWKLLSLSPHPPNSSSGGARVRTRGVRYPLQPLNVTVQTLKLWLLWGFSFWFFKTVALEYYFILIKCLGGSLKFGTGDTASPDLTLILGTDFGNKSRRSHGLSLFLSCHGLWNHLELEKRGRGHVGRMYQKLISQGHTGVEVWAVSQRLFPALILRRREDETELGAPGWMYRKGEAHSPNPPQLSAAAKTTFQLRFLTSQPSIAG